MTSKTVTRADLTDAVLSKMGSLSRSNTAKLVDEILETVSQELEVGNTVKISSFGTFLVRSKNQRIGRNPKTGEEAIINPRKVVSFNASPILKHIINDK